MSILTTKLDLFKLFLLAAIIVIIAIVCYNYFSYNLPKTIWMYWDNDVLPKNIELIKQYNEPAFRGWNVIYLNPTTLYNYVDKDQVPPAFHTLIVQHQADWIRLYVLKKYGGVWIDASIIFNDANSLNKIWKQSVQQKSVFTTFIGGAYIRHISGVKIPILIDNWFIMAPTNSHIIDLWFQEFNQAVTMGLLNYKQRKIKDGVDISSIHFKDEDDVYLTQHICIQSVFQKKLKNIPSCVFIQSGTSMFAVQNKCKWKKDCTVNTILHDPQVRKLPYIKLTRHERDDITAYFEH